MALADVVTRSGLTEADFTVLVATRPQLGWKLNPFGPHGVCGLKSRPGLSRRFVPRCSFGERLIHGPLPAGTPRLDSGGTDDEIEMVIYSVVSQVTRLLCLVKRRSMTVGSVAVVGVLIAAMLAPTPAVAATHKP